MNRKTKKGFSLIELLIVMAIMAILVLIATPRYLNYTREARSKQIVSDIKITESKLSEYLIKNNDQMPIGGSAFDTTTIAALIANRALYDAKGLVTSLDEAEAYNVISQAWVKRETGSKLSGRFIGTTGGDVYYINDVFDAPDGSDSETPQDTSPQVVNLAANNTSLNENGETFIAAGQVTITGQVNKNSDVTLSVNNIIVPITYDDTSVSWFFTTIHASNEMKTFTAIISADDNMIYNIEIKCGSVSKLFKLSTKKQNNVYSLKNTKSTNGAVLPKSIINTALYDKSYITFEADIVTGPHTVYFYSSAAGDTGNKHKIQLYQKDSSLFGYARRYGNAYDTWIKNEINFNFEPNKAYHVAVTDNLVTNELKFYINGDLYETQTYSHSSTKFTSGVGNHSPRFLSYYDSTTLVRTEGSLDNFRIWDVVRTPEEIKANYNKLLTGTETGLMVYFTFDNYSNGTAKSLVGDYSATIPSLLISQPINSLIK